MEKLLIFAGTREGRLLAEHMCRWREVHVSVATEYGGEVLPKDKGIHVHQGRLTAEQMRELLLAEPWRGVIDATHPYAVEVSENIKSACESTGQPYLRLLREQEAEDKDAVYVNSKEEAAQYLNRVKGNILLTTGSKELEAYMKLILDSTRIYARILADGETVTKCRDMGLGGKQIICMQGPFSTELNAAMLKQLDARYLVTKDTGAVGGLPQKLEGARLAGATAVVIRRPREESGYSMEELLAYLGVPGTGQPESAAAQPETAIGQPKFAAAQPEDARPVVTLLGIGMGNVEGMTLEAYQACQQADVILGAQRMIKTLEYFGKPVEAIYQPQAVMEFLKQHPRYCRVVVAFSGDIGFYSGTRRMREALAESGYQVKLVCGISSVVYAASRLNMSWEDMKLVSIHGRSQNIIGAVRTNAKVFSLVGKEETVRQLAHALIQYGLGTIKMHVAYQLGYPEEEILTGEPEEFCGYDRKGLAVVILENPKAAEAAVTHGMPDESFVRGKAPMTKEEIRSISISKLALKKDALVYDIGAGTGSVAVECALQASEGRVYAIEKKEEALALLAENRDRLGAGNLEIVSGTAPETLKELPAPTHAFIGGSGGNMEEILKLLLSKNPRVRIVINAIALETVAEVMELIGRLEFDVADIVQVSVGKSRELGRYHMMMGQNPVYIFTLQKE